MLPECVQRLVAQLSKLPGVGPRSAERITLHIVQADKTLAADLAQALVDARSNTRFCSTCGSLTQDSPCGLCKDPNRDGSLICVVEKPVDILSIEKSGAFRGRFHVLGGTISPLDGVGPEDLNIASLEQRLNREAIHEIILAMGTHVEGDATSHYLARRFARTGLKMSRIGFGLPAGSGLEYADELTLNRALDGRREMT